MLSFDEQRQLELIESGLWHDDPRFAERFTNPRPARRWPLALLLVVAGVAFVVGLVVANLLLVGVAVLVSAGTAALACWRDRFS